MEQKHIDYYYKLINLNLGALRIISEGPKNICYTYFYLGSLLIVHYYILDIFLSWSDIQVFRSFQHIVKLIIHKIYLKHGIFLLLYHSGTIEAGVCIGFAGI